jgi:hypothetical protein
MTTFSTGPENVHNVHLEPGKSAPVSPITLLKPNQTLRDEGNFRLRRYDMSGRFQMQGGKNWILPKEINANRFF